MPTPFSSSPSSSSLTSSESRYSPSSSKRYFRGNPNDLQVPLNSSNHSTSAYSPFVSSSSPSPSSYYSPSSSSSCFACTKRNVFRFICIILLILFFTAMSYSAYEAWLDHRAKENIPDYFYSLNVASIQYFPFGLSYPYISPNQTLYLNLQQYSSFAQQAKQRSAELIVFPEAGLGYLQAMRIGKRDYMRSFCEIIPPINSNPCGEQEQQPKFSDSVPVSQVTTLSCIARQNEITIVVNLCSLQQCSSTTDPFCPSDGYYQFNTNLIVSYDGSIIGYYHKQHLFSEQPYFDSSPPNDPAAFILFQPFQSKKLSPTPFSTLICFDIEFSNPLNQIPNNAPLLYSSWWQRNQPPQLTSSLLQQSLSFIRRTNVIAANTLSSLAQGGGIYSSGIPLAVAWNRSRTAKEGEGDISVATIELNDNYFDPIFIPQFSDSAATLPSSLSNTDILMKNDSIYCAITAVDMIGNCTFLSPNQTQQHLTASNGNVTCSLDITLAGLDYPNDRSLIQTYALYASDYYYPISKSNTTLLLQSCFLLRCVGPTNGAGTITVTQCNRDVYNASLFIEDYSIEASFSCSSFTSDPNSAEDHGSVFPILGVKDAQPMDLNVLDYSYVGRRESDETCWWSLQSNQPIMDPLWSTGLYAAFGSD